MIPNPLPGPRLPPPPEPVAIPIPRMGPALGAPATAVRPVTESEFAELCAWLVPRLAADHPGGHPDFVQFYLWERMLNKSCWLAHAGPLVGLAEFHRSPVAPLGFVTEVFVRSREPDNANAVLLYRAMRDWAIGVGAAEFRFNIDSDAAMTQVTPALFDLSRDIAPRKRSLYVAQLR